MAGFVTIDVRSTAPGEARATAETVAASLFFPRPSDEQWAQRQESWESQQSISAWDGGRCVGHAGAFRFDTTVPGGARVASTGVTRVGVLPTHTRRGLLRRMMTELLDGARGEGRLLASLRASEALIYGRFGFGVAGEAVTVTIDAHGAGAVRAPAPGSIRLLDRDEMVEVVGEVYDRCARGRAGAIGRSRYFTEQSLREAVTGEKQSVVAAHADPDGTLDGYVHYDVRWEQAANTMSEDGIGEVHDLFGADPAIERALWAYLLDIDLIVQWRVETRPIDDPIRLAIADPRAYRVVHRWDEQWLRLLDVDAALSARTYAAADGSVVIAVDDAQFPDNCGTWRIGAKGAERVDGDADLHVDVAAVSAAYLGGTSWQELHAAGIIAGEADAIAAADTLFGARPSPFCGTFF